MSKPEYKHEETAGLLGSQSIIHAWPCDGGGTWLLARGDCDHHQAFQAALIPADPAELHRLTEAIRGEPGTWVPTAYEEVAEVADGTIEIGGGPERCVARAGDNPNWLRNHAANSIALAEYLEAQEAANAEAEREEQEQVDALAKELYREWRTETGEKDWAKRGEYEREGWRAVAHKVIADRAPQPEAEQTCEGGC